MKPDKRSTQTLAAIVFAGVFAAAVGANAALITSGTYDEQSTQANAVDTEASGNTISLDFFKTLVDSFYLGDAGGVIHFDDQTAGTELANADSDEPNDDDGVHEAVGIPDDEGFAVNYGFWETQTLRVAMGDLTDRPDKPDKNPDIWEGAWTVTDTSSDRTPVSGSMSMGGVTDYHFEFSRALLAVGVTVLSRDASQGRDVTVTLYYNDDTSDIMVTDEEIDDANGTDDTFFGYVAPEDKLIRSIHLDIDYSGGGLEGNPGFTNVDDLAFITPEPTTLALLALSGLALLRRPRRG